MERHGAQVYRLCLSILANPQDAEDAGQAVFLKAYRALERFEGRSSFATWLTRIAINQCKDSLRRRRRGRAESLDALLDTGGPLPAALVEPAPAPAHEALPQDLLDRLSPDERGLLELAGSDDEPGYRELGRRLGISVDSVKGRLKRARQKLRRLWSAREAS